MTFAALRRRAAAGHDEAIKYFTAAAQAALVQYPDDSLVYAQSIVSLGACCVGMGDYLQAEQFLLQAWKIRRRKTARCHFSVAEVLHLLANCYHGMKLWEMAMQYYTRTLECLAFLGADHPLHVQVARNAVLCAAQQQQQQEQGEQAA